MTVYLMLHSNGLVFTFTRNDFSRVLQFFQGHYSNSVLLPFLSSSILILTAFPESRDVLLSNLTPEGNREVRDG